MGLRKRQPTVFALWTAVDPEEPRRNRPWDPGRLGRTRNTLRTRCYLMGSGMIQLILGSARNKGYKAQKEGCTTSLLERVCAEWLAGAKRANKIVGC